MIKRIMRKICIISLFCVICFLSGVPRVKAAVGQYVSEIVLQEGEDAEDKLSEKGYSVMYPALLNGEGEKIRIGYKTSKNSKDGITDIIVGKKKKNAKKKIRKKLVKYQLVQGGSLGVGGEAGKPDKTSYLYCTKDGRAGSPLMALHFMSSDTNDVDGFEKLMPLANNGTMPVKGFDEIAVTVQTDGNSGYLSVVRSDVWKNYIGSLTVVKGDTEKDVVMELCRLGCEYYVDKNYGRDGDVIMVGYTRTSDKKSAVKDLIGLSADEEAPVGYEKAGDTEVAGKYLFTSTDEKYGNPLVDLDYMKNAEELELTAKEWTALVAARGDNTVTASYLTGSEEYINLQKSKEKYVLTGVDCEDEKDIGLVYITEKAGRKEKQTKEDGQDEDVSGAAIDTDGVGTVLSGSKAEFSGTIQTIVLILIILLIPVVTIIIKKKNEKQV